MTSESAPHSMRRLGFVHSSATFSYSQAEALYRRLRSYTPSMVEGWARKGEDLATAIIAPYVHQAQDLGDRLLHFADSKAGTARRNA